jgi:subtilisin family serine protease
MTCYFCTLVYNYEDDMGIANVGARKTWNVMLKPTDNDFFVNALCEWRSAAVKCISQGHPADGGLSYVSVECSEAELLRFVENHKDGIIFIEPDLDVSIPPDEEDAEQDAASADDFEVGISSSSGKKDILWGLDRIDARKGLDKSYETFGDGKGVHVYVFDTGIRSSHEQFEGRVIAEYDNSADNFGNPVCKKSWNPAACAQDRHGHGTHAAGTAGGKSMGVAKSVTLHAIKVLDKNGDGHTNNILQAIDYAISNVEMPAVFSMSLGSSKQGEAWKEAVDKAVKKGIVVVAAAGNTGTDACKLSPANCPSAITVGSTDKKDKRSIFRSGLTIGGSNIGPCVDIFAPGSSITSAWADDDSSYKSKSGTSMACPHVAGVAAMYLQANPAMKPKEVLDALVRMGTKDVIADVGEGSPNILLYAKEVPNIQKSDDPPRRRRSRRRRRKSSRRRRRRSKSTTPPPQKGRRRRRSKSTSPPPQKGRRRRRSQSTSPPTSSPPQQRRRRRDV